MRDALIGGGIFVAVVVVLWPLAQTGFPMALALALAVVVALYGVVELVAAAQRALEDEADRAAHDLTETTPALAGDVEGVR